MGQPRPIGCWYLSLSDTDAFEFPRFPYVAVEGMREIFKTQKYPLCKSHNFWHWSHFLAETLQSNEWKQESSY